MKFEENTRRADGRPRALIFDGHFSHMAIDAVIFLRSKNVRVMTVHPHTTHLVCVLDNGPFRRFNYFLKVEVASLSPPGTPVTDSNLSGCVKRAWESTLKITIDPKTGKPSSPVLSAFAKTGIYPLSRAIMETDIFTVSDFYKSENDAAGVAADPSAVRPKLTITAEQLAALREEIKKVDKSLDASLKDRIARAPRTKMSELLTSSEWLSKEVDNNLAAAAAETAATAKREQKAADKLARGGLTKTEFEKKAAGAKALEKAALKATEALLLTTVQKPPPAPLVVPKVALKKKAAVLPEPMVAEVNPYAKGYGAVRGAKRARVEE